MTVEQTRERKAAYMRRYRILNPEIMRRVERATKLRNRDKVLARKAAYRKKNADKIREYNKKYQDMKAVEARQWRKRWAREHPEIYRFARAKRRASELMAMPPWADKDALKAVYAERERIVRETGIQHHVDHIIPLQGKTVCGLHVHWNLQIIPAVENYRKGNKLVEAL